MKRLLSCHVCVWVCLLADHSIFNKKHIQSQQLFSLLSKCLLKKVVLFLYCHSFIINSPTLHHLVSSSPLYSCRPMLEMTIPSTLDPTLAPPGCHVVSLFTQFTPYHIEGREWTNQDREAFADTGNVQWSDTSYSATCAKTPAKYITQAYTEWLGEKRTRLSTFWKQEV